MERLGASATTLDGRGGLRTRTGEFVNRWPGVRISPSAPVSNTNPYHSVPLCTPADHCVSGQLSGQNQTSARGVEFGQWRGAVVTTVAPFAGGPSTRSRD